MNQSMMILAVDDEPLNLMILKELFEETHKIILAESAENAIAQLEKTIPHIILLDVMMPGIGGIELCRRVRAMPNMQDVKIIMVSGKAMDHDIQVGIDAGADHYISKPFDMIELVEIVESYD
ncbi:response regulator [Beggiatoa alba]|nr:response regulator [Beggiatoa alba]